MASMKPISLIRRQKKASTKCSQNSKLNTQLWDNFENQPPYEHPWKDIPDIVNVTAVEFWFNMTHHILTGIERGMYMNDNITLDPQCFGPDFVNKTN